VTTIFSTALPKALIASALPFLVVLFLNLGFMNPVDHRVTTLVRDSETLHQSFEDSSLIFEPAKSQRQQRRRRRLYRRERRARVAEEARLARLMNHGERILRFLTRQYPSLEAAEGTHWYKVYNKVQDRIQLHRSAISNDDDILIGFSALSL
jgi:hypothetical protein